MAKIILLTRVVRVSLSRSLNNLLLGCFLLSAIDLVAVETSSKQRGSITREEEGKSQTPLAEGWGTANL